MFLGPFFPTPFTDLFGIITPNFKVGMQHDLCGRITMRFYNCLEAYGSEKSKDKCLDLFYDVYECSHKRLQKLRVEEIQKERKRKYKAGEIDELYSEKPPLESCFHI